LARSSASVDAVVFDDADGRTPDSGAGPRPAKKSSSSKAKDDPGLDGGAHIGRYVVLYRHGRGGMGNIYAAYDPELDRRVAIKLLKRSRRRGRDAHARMVREAQALARLSHPNVVAIHDVGLHEGRVWVAMDFIDGLTLRRWVAAESRSTDELLAVFVQAGQGLAAAHKAGLIHRDFKPENVIVDSDGRAQVLDFGLARASTSGAPSGIRRGSVDSVEREPAAISTSSGSLSMRLTRDGALVGTPAYMAPEQHLREPTDDRTDQFAFCLALYEALYREMPFVGDDDKELKKNVVAGNMRPAPRKSKVPAWLRKVLLQGLAVEPSDRWPNMDALLAELARDRGRGTRRVATMLGGAALIGALGFAGSVLVSSDSERCDDADAPIAEVWNDDRRNAVEASFMTTGKPYAAAAWRNTRAVLDNRAQTWSTARREACEATWVRGVQPQEVLVRRLSCLQRRLDELDGLIGVFERADPTVVERAVQAAHDLTGIEGCADVDALDSQLPLPEDPRDRVLAEDLRARLSEAHTRERAGKYREGVELATTAVEDARALGFRPLEAEALVTLGRLQLRDGKTRDALESLREAVFTAEAGGHIAAAGDAWVLLLEVAYLRPETHADATEWGRHATALVEHLGRGSQLDASLQRAEGNLRAIQGRPADAVRHLRRAAEILEARGGETPELGETLTDLGNAYTELGRLDEARDHHERALRIATEQLGETHPGVASAMTGLALAYDELGRTDESYPLYESAVTIFKEALGPWHPSVATALNNYAGVLYAKGDYADALEKFERAAAIWEAAYGPEHPDVALTLGNIGLALEGLGRVDEAIEHHERALELRTAAWGPEHPDVAISLRNLGDLYWYRERYSEAKTQHERAVKVLEASLGPDHPRVAKPLEGLASDEHMLGNYDAALQHYRRALTLRETALGSEHEFVAAVLTEIGRVQLDAQAPLRAVGPLERAVQIHDNSARASLESAASRFALARAVLAGNEDAPKARRLARQARAEAREVDVTAELVGEIEGWLSKLEPEH